MVSKPESSLAISINPVGLGGAASASVALQVALPAQPTFALLIGGGGAACARLQLDLVSLPAACDKTEGEMTAAKQGAAQRHVVLVH